VDRRPGSTSAGKESRAQERLLLPEVHLRTSDFEVAEKLLPKFSRLSEQYQQEIIAISNGTAEQLAEVVELVANKKIEPPPHSVFPCEQAAEVIAKLCNSEIPGRAILRFHDIE